MHAENKTTFFKWTCILFWHKTLSHDPFSKTNCTGFITDNKYYNKTVPFTGSTTEMEVYYTVIFNLTHLTNIKQFIYPFFGVVTSSVEI
jgi:hypothetical protein